MRKTIAVREYMSRLPEEVDRRAKVSTAVESMARCQVRHVPVMDGPAVFGILSRLDLLDAWMRYGSRAGDMAVAELCTRLPLTVSPLATIPDVARQMVERGVTSALVTDGATLVGIFTSTDALRVLASL